jgi:cytochrome b561
VFTLFGVGLWMVDLDYYSSWYQTAPTWHKSIGILLAIATIARFVWKTFTKSPPIEGAVWEKFAAKAAHGLMYLLLLTLFTSGYLISTEDGRAISVFGWFDVPSLGKLFNNQADLAGQIHYWVAVSLMALVAVHAAAALKHHFIDKDNTLRKMLGVKR